APELQQVASVSGVDGFVSVQARQSVEETEELLAISDSEPLIRGVVGWLPLADPNVSSLMEKFSGRAKLKGIRHVVQDEPDDEFILGADFNRGVGELERFDWVYDILVFAKQLPASNKFARQHPNVRMVLDHIAKPAIDPKAEVVDPSWEPQFRELAKCDNVVCKFSGVVTEVEGWDWSIETIRPYFEIALEAFGPKRLMFGSDWPVCLLASEYSRWLETVQQLASELSPSEQKNLFYQTAIDTYQLSE
ncbi:MAG: amidohydrolase family protein, partial [Planctomycetota bacterium]